MARSCRMLQPEAERILWRKIVLARTVTVIPFCRRLSATPRLAQYVLELNIGFFEDYNHKTELQIFPQTLRRVISRLLEQTTGLRVLNLHISYFRTETDHLRVDTCGSLFDHCTFKLHHFASEFVLDDRLISFLETQPDIRILALLVAKDTEALLPLHVLSKLASFGSNQFDTLLYVLRHWSITHVALPTFGSAACLSRIAQSTHTIKVLNLCCYHATLSELCNLENNFLPNLELLCGLQMSYDHEEEDCIRLVSKFPKLRKLALESALEDEKMLPFATECRRFCASLHVLQYTQRSGLRYEFNYDEEAGWKAVYFGQRLWLSALEEL